MNETIDRPQRARSNSGRWLVVALFVLAGAIVLAFYETSYKFDPAPKEAVWGKPSRSIRVISIDAKSAPDLQSLADRINAAKADVVLVQRLEGSQLDSLAEQITMPQPGRVQVFYPAQNVAGAEPTYGNAVFSVFPLYEGRSIPNKGGSFGVWTTAVFDGHKFMLASINFSTPPDKESTMLEKAWKELGSPPMITGGDAAGVIFPEATGVKETLLLWGGLNVDYFESGVAAVH